MEFTWQYVEKWARERPGAEALVFGDRRLTWREVADEMNACAKALLACGVERGDRVAMLAMARPEFIVTFMAANKIGASWLGLSPKFSAKELAYMLGDCRPKVLFSLKRYLDYDLAAVAGEALASAPVPHVVALDEAFADAPLYSDWAARAGGVSDDALARRAAEGQPDDVTLLMYTSGSTGKPKGVEHTHRSVIANVEVQNLHFVTSHDTRALLHFPINHVAADVEIGFACVMAGAAIVMMDRFDPAATLEIIPKERITMFGQVPAMFMLEMALPAFRETDFSSVDCIVWGGASAPRPVLEALDALAKRVGARLLTGYGATEMGGFVTFSRPDDDLDLLCKTAGYAPEPFELKIVDDAGANAPVGETGEVCVRGPFLMKGYFNKPEQTAAVIDTDGWYHSGDLGHLDAAGNLFLNGRKSEMFKTGGENVFPREVEDALESHPAVFLAAVVAVPDPLFQEVGRAYVMVKPGANPSAGELKAHCQAHLANFKVPKSFEVRPLLPMLPNGKVNKLALKEEATS